MAVFAAALTLGILGVAGCASEAPPPLPEVDASDLPFEPDPAIEKTCGMLSLVATMWDRARVDSKPYNYTQEQVVTIINLTPDILRSVDLNRGGLGKQMTELLNSIDQTPPVLEGATFDPYGEPFRSRFLDLSQSCADNKTEIGVMSITGGG